MINDHAGLRTLTPLVTLSLVVVVRAVLFPDFGLSLSQSVRLCMYVRRQVCFTVTLNYFKIYLMA